MRAASFIGGLACVAAACGGAPDVPLFDDGGTTPVDSGTDGTSSCDISQCGSIPSGWTPVNVSNAACPSGWTQSGGVADPKAGDGTCTCSCNVTAQPSCASGDIHRTLDQSSAATCGTAATTLTAPDSTCQPMPGTYLQLLGYHYQTDPVAPSGGTCEYDALLDPSKVTSTTANICAPPASCPGAACGAGFCVQQSGDVACPSGFSQKHTVGAKPNVTCAPCATACTPTGTCTGTLAMFTDQFCTQNEVDFTADSTCVSNPGTLDGIYYSFTWTGSISGATCSGTTPTSAATVTVDTPTTVCCAP